MHFESELSKSDISNLDAIFIKQQDHRQFRKMKKNNFITLPPVIEEMIKSGNEAKIKYISRSGEVTERVILPEEIVRYKDYLYLIGYCYMRDEKRTFRLDRIISLKQK